MVADGLEGRIRSWLTRRTTLSAVRRVGELPIAIGTDVGLVRKENQDRLVVLKFQESARKSFVVIVLCDGMGGMAEGAECASIAVSTFLAVCCRRVSIPFPSRLIAAAHEANRAVHQLFGGRGGATLSAVSIDSQGNTVAVNIGDSRIYTYADELQQLTIDDTIAGQLKDREIHEGLRRNELLQFVGVGEGLEPHLYDVPAKLKYVIITSDGVHFLEKRMLQLVTRHGSEPAVIVRRLIDVAKWSGGHDNSSVAVISPALTASMKFEDANVIQLWDAFGEVQIVTVPSDQSPELHPAKLSSQSPADFPNDKPKLKKPRKARPKKKPSIFNEDQIENDKEVRPQLKIDFKDEEGGDGNV